MQELNFEDLDNTLIDSLTYSCAVYNIEHCGMTWDGIKTLWPDSAGMMQARYEAENAKRGDV